MTLLEDEEWSQWSDVEIARQCAVSNRTVGRIRSSLCQSQSDAPPRTYTTKHGTTATMNTSNIGKRRGELLGPAQQGKRTDLEHVRHDGQVKIPKQTASAYRAIAENWDTIWPVLSPRARGLPYCPATQST